MLNRLQNDLLQNDLGAPLSRTSKREMKEHSVLPCGNFASEQAPADPIPLLKLKLLKLKLSKLKLLKLKVGTPPWIFEGGVCNVERQKLPERAPFPSPTPQNCHPHRSSPRLHLQLRSCLPPSGCEVVGLRSGGPIFDLNDNYTLNQTLVPPSMCHFAIPTDSTPSFR
jgi:hypothetical protein